MRSRARPRSVHARRAVLIVAVCLLAASAALFAAAALLQLSPDTSLRRAGVDLRAIVAYPLLGGVLFAVLYFVIQKAAHEAEADGPKSMVFGDSTTMQEMPGESDERLKNKGQRPPHSRG